ncbi:MAG: ThiF family adenylyltransferase [Mariniblastus sp.]|nr:ThiF family adenylyltransferase [Mariniblastus sp.]
MENNPEKTSPHHKEPELLIDDSDRYSRLRLIGWWDQDKIANAKILVVGAGALGNEVLKNLALLGVGQIHLIDFDEIQDHNLTRSVLFRAHHAGRSKAEVAAQMATELNPDCTIIAQHGDVLTDIGLGLIRDANLVICCVDNREARLWINRMCWKANTPWIDGGIQEINGVAKVFMPPHGSCYECAMTENDYRLISLRYSCPLLRQEDLQQGKVPTAPTIASIIGGLQVQEALKLIHDLPAAVGKALVFNGAANRFYQTTFPPREDCLSHETYEDLIELPLSAQKTTVKQLFEAIARSDSTPPSAEAKDYRLLLDRDFVTELTCRSCDSTKRIYQTLCKVGSSDGLCERCSEPVSPNTTCEITSDSNLTDRTLSQLGIPNYDIVKVNSGEENFFVLLGEDAATAFTANTK